MWAPSCEKYIRGLVFLAVALRVPMLSLVLLLVALGPVLAAVPKISYYSTEQIKHVGDNVEFECFVDHGEDFSTSRGPHPVGWVKVDKNNSTLPISLGDDIILRDRRINLGIARTHTFAATYILEIKDVKEADAGLYQCQVTDASNNKITADIKLSVQKILTLG